MTIIMTLILSVGFSDLCPSLSELQVYDQVKEDFEISERDTLRFSEDLKNKVITLDAAAPDLKIFIKRDLEILRQSLALKTVSKDQKKKSESLLKELEKSSVPEKDFTQKRGEVAELIQENLKSYDKVFKKCRKPGNP